MEECSTRWREWRELFESRSGRPLPAVSTAGRGPQLPASLARSLAIFQLGESGGGTIIEQARHSLFPQIDGHYAVAMSLFVKEENRHAEILAMCVRYLDGKLIHKNWTARLFVVFRRLMGLRLKVIVLLAAEVVGICYYYLLSLALPQCHIKECLSDLVADEESHLYFHCDFLGSQVTSFWRQVIFVVVWRCTMVTAAIAVMIDHRAAIKDLGIKRRTIWRRWMTYSRLAERLIIGASANVECID